MFRYCRVNGPECREDRCVEWRTRLFVRCLARWWALGYREFVSPSLVIRDRCPKPNTCLPIGKRKSTMEHRPNRRLCLLNPKSKRRRSAMNNLRRWRSIGTHTVARWAASTRLSSEACLQFSSRCTSNRRMKCLTSVRDLFQHPHFSAIDQGCCVVLSFPRGLRPRVQARRSVVGPCLRTVYAAGLLVPAQTTTSHPQPPWRRASSGPPYVSPPGPGPQRPPTSQQSTSAGRRCGPSQSIVTRY